MELARPRVHLLSPVHLSPSSRGAAFAIAFKTPLGGLLLLLFILTVLINVIYYICPDNEC